MKQVIVLLLLLQMQAVASPKCDDALSACQDLVQAQDESIATLKRQVSTLEDRLKDSQPPTILTPFNTFLIGIVAGVIGTALIVRH